MHLSVVQLSGDLPGDATSVACKSIENAGTAVDGIVHRRSFDLSESTEHEVGGVDTIGGTTDPDLQPPEVSRSERAHQRADAVVPTGTSPELHTESPKRKIDVIVDDEQLLPVDSLVAHQRSDSLAALVHERTRQREDRGDVTGANRGHIRANA